MYKGRKYTLRIIEDSKFEKITIRNKKFIEIHLTSLSSSFDVERMYDEWLRNDLTKLLETKISSWEKIVKKNVTSWKIRRMKTKWGSCNDKTGNILFNFELIKKSELCIDYVVLHEILHLVEKKHNKNFVNLLSKYMPNWQTIKNDLNSGMLPHTNWNH